MAQNNLNLTIISPDKRTNFEEVSSIILPTTFGEIQILPNHGPLIAELELGEAIINSAKQSSQSLAIYGGFVRIDGTGQVELVVDEAQYAQELDLEQINSAYQSAVQAMELAPEYIDDQMYQEKLALVQREALRLRVAKKHHSKTTYR